MVAGSHHDDYKQKDAEWLTESGSNYSAVGLGFMC